MLKSRGVNLSQYNFEKGKMKPHTRTQCDGKDCVECGQGDKNVGTGQEDLSNGSLEQNEKRFVY